MPQNKSSVRRMTFLDWIKIWLLPKYMVSDILAELRASAFGKGGNDDEDFARHEVLWSLAESRYATDFLEDIINVANDPDPGVCRRIAAIQVLGHCFPGNEEAAAGLIAVYVKDVPDINGTGPLAWVKFPIDKYIHDIARSFRDRSKSNYHRTELMNLASAKLEKSSRAYVFFTNETSLIALDKTEESWIRESAVRTLDAIRHRDILLELIKDSDVNVRRAAVEVLNAAALSK